jgi:hypothetical protein
MDIMTYMREGRGRHADSLGNREEFLAGSWISNIFQPDRTHQASSNIGNLCHINSMQVLGHFSFCRMH